MQTKQFYFEKKNGFLRFFFDIFRKSKKSNFFENAEKKEFYSKIKKNDFFQKYKRSIFFSKKNKFQKQDF